MPDTTITPLVHSPDEHSIVVMLDGETAQKVADLQGQLKALLGDAIWLTPSNALHITLMEIICDTEYQEISREAHFKNWYENYTEPAKETIATYRPIDATFNEILASPAAIILKAVNPEPFNDIRDALLKTTVLPAQTKMPPDIIHCSIARFSKSVDLDGVRERVNQLLVNFEIHITEFKLMKDLGPDFQPTELETYRLLAE